ncbi:hypothetical protein RRG08_009154 [Elysia crispata]|uniref:HTH CENPB-type domain-containing protein n=1 Tax=Elysia crispata TaxID=231223 RepID=A0AAE1AYG5_9GAST|nr:hypothetical protein RRG08_029729 [Elysia crispata]KAK3796207.1 hypothetical protein RRG08_009154 [Elysia crispata]
MTGEDWAERFMKRHPMISLRTPEATSLQRMACFNKYNVNSFYDNLSTVMEEKSFTPDRIYNCDEKGVTTVQRPTKQIAETGAKRVGSVVSQERGALVTVCCSVNAIGNRIPPFCVFPRVCTLDVWQENLPTGSAGMPYQMTNFFRLSRPIVQCPLKNQWIRVILKYPVKKDKKLQLLRMRQLHLPVALHLPQNNLLSQPIQMHPAQNCQKKSVLSRKQLHVNLDN